MSLISRDVAEQVGKKTCPSCETRFTPTKSNQRYCSVSCRQHADNVRSGKIKRVSPEKLKQRRRRRSVSVARKIGAGISNLDFSDVQELRVKLLRRDLTLCPEQVSWLNRLFRRIANKAISKQQFQKEAAELLKMPNSLPFQHRWDEHHFWRDDPLSSRIGNWNPPPIPSKSAVAKVEDVSRPIYSGMVYLEDECPVVGSGYRNIIAYEQGDGIRILIKSPAGRSDLITEKVWRTIKRAA
jgi:hypothetical protein